MRLVDTYSTVHEDPRVRSMQVKCPLPPPTAPPKALRVASKHFPRAQRPPPPRPSFRTLGSHIVLETCLFLNLCRPHITSFVVLLELLELLEPLKVLRLSLIELEVFLSPSLSPSCLRKNLGVKSDEMSKTPIAGQNGLD